jgi:hypothetical protein
MSWHKNLLSFKQTSSKSLKNMPENKRTKTLNSKKSRETRPNPHPPKRKKRQQNNKNSTQLLIRAPHDHYSNMSANNSSKKENPSYILIKQSVTRTTEGSQEEGGDELERH